MGFEGLQTTCMGDIKMPGSTFVTCWTSTQYVYGLMQKVVMDFDKSEKGFYSFDAVSRMISLIMKGCVDIYSIADQTWTSPSAAEALEVS